LALNLLTSPKLATLTTSDSVAASVIRAIGLNQPLPADRILQPIVADASKQFDDYEMEFSYLDDSQLQDLSWDEFHRWYFTSGYIHGQIVTRCLISPVTLPPTLPKILDEVRMCYAFGQLAAIYGLCRGLVETAITDVCVRIGAITKAQLEDDYFFKDFPPTDASIGRYAVPTSLRHSPSTQLHPASSTDRRHPKILPALFVALSRWWRGFILVMHIHSHRTETPNPYVRCQVWRRSLVSS
jgi:hypothetical protein